MARAWRIEFSGALYHAMARGNEGRPIFGDDRDRRRFMDLLAEASERFELEVFAFVLMPNHYHLLLRTRQPNLSKAMQWLGVSYTVYFNLRHNRVGHLFQGRFKSILVQDDRYLLRLSCYIHRNPVRAGLVDRLADYRWSSYRTYAYGVSPGSWLRTNLILSQMESCEDRHRAYREMAQAYSQEEDKTWEDLRYGFILGAETFAAELKARHLPAAVNREVPEQKRISEGVVSDTALRLAADYLECDLANCRLHGNALRSSVQSRDLLIYLAWRAGGQTNAEIGRRFGLSHSAVSRRVRLIRASMDKDADLRDRFDQLNRLAQRSEAVG